MRIYFCGAILGGRDHLAVYQHMVGLLQLRGHEVLTAHVASPHVLEEERALTAREVFARDECWIRESDIMIAEISTPSLGVGYEIGRGLQLGMPVLCLHRAGLAVSRMISGNTAPNLQVRAYQNPEELDRHLEEFLTEISRKQQ
jgi:2'-deoxynucleoside 5'-phosphate N-hydrolase